MTDLGRHKYLGGIAIMQVTGKCSEIKCINREAEVKGKSRL